jgi:lipopolysaccharide transport system permease protein
MVSWSTSGVHRQESITFENFLLGIILRKMPQDFEFKIEPPKKLSFNFQELWQFRELFYFFTWRDVKVKYKQTALGILWVLIQPVLTVIIFTVFFGRVFKISSGELPYPIFVFSGLLFWNAFSSSLTNAGNSMVSNAPIIKKIYFPRLIIPISSILTSLVDMLVGLALFVLTILFFPFQEPLHVDWLLLLPMTVAALVLMVVGTIGLCCLLSALNVKYRDFRYVVPFALQVMLFLTPVIYPINILYYPGLQYFLALNPMYAVIELFRYPFLHELDLPLVFISLGSSVVLLIWGLYYFKSTEHYFADLA